MSKKNVFVTTLSTLRPKQARRLAYYSAVGQDGTKKYFTGISTNEPGAKYLFSTEDIDKMVIIGSDKTHGAEVSNYTSLNKMDYHHYQADVNNESAYAYLLYRLSQYCDHVDIEAETLSNKTASARKTQLETLIRECLEGAGYSDPGKWFEILAGDRELEKQVQSVIREDIRKNYLDPEDYQAYSEDLHYTEFPELTKLEEGELSIDEMIRELKQMEDEAFSTFLDRELFLAMGLRSLDNRISTLEKERLEKRNEALTQVIEKLRYFNIQLQLELTDIKNHREEEEIAYAKYYLFRMLSESSKLSPRVTSVSGHESNADVRIDFVPLKLGDMDNISGIISAISDSAAEEETIDLYIDVQGGGRTDAFIRNQIFSVLANETGSRISIKKIISVDFETRNFANSILDETKDYQISDLVSGMNAFTSYGKAGILKKFFLQQGSKGYLHSLMNIMENIDHAISLCDIVKMEDGINKLKIKLDSKQSDENQMTEMFDVLKAGILRDYGSLLQTDKIDPLDLVKWAYKKDLLQQAITIIEARIPSIIVQNKIIYCYNSKDMKEMRKLVEKENRGNYNWESDEQHLLKRYPRYLAGKKKPLEEVLIYELKHPSPDGKPYVDRDNKTHFVLASNLLESEDNKIKNLIKEYNELCQQRNQMNHAGGRDRWNYDELRKKIQDFIEHMEALIKMTT